MIRKLEDMCHDINFNKADAVELMKQMDINQEFEREHKWGVSYPTTLQAEAIDNHNIEMLSLLLENGAEDLFDWVWFEICNEPYGDSWIYRSRFFILLFAYGGRTRCWKPKIVKDFDKSQMNKYRLSLLREKIGSHCAYIEDDKKEIVAYL